MRKLARKIVTLRAEMGYTQLDLANVSGVSVNQIGNIEGAKDESKQVADPKFTTIFRLAYAFNISMDELLKPDDED